MPDTVDDFMRRFAGGGTVDDVDAIRFHDRFVSTHPDDAHFDNRAYHEAATQYLGQLPDDQFQMPRGTRWRRRRRRKERDCLTACSAH